MVVMQLSRVMRCGCGRHAWVIMRDPTSERMVQVQVDGTIGLALLAEMSGLSGSHAESFDLLRSTLVALGARAESLVLRAEGSAIAATLCVQGLRGRTSVDVDPCNALLAACRMKLPILVDEPDAAEAFDPNPGTDLPPVYHEVLEELRLRDCDTPPATGNG